MLELGVLLDDVLVLVLVLGVLLVLVLVLVDDVLEVVADEEVEVLLVVVAAVWELALATAATTPMANAPVAAAVV